MASEADNQGVDPAAARTRPRPSYKRRFFRMISWAGVSMLILFALSNLWLWSPWGTGMVEAKLEERSGQDWQIGSMSWSPWNGVTLYDTEMLQPDELREVLDQPVVSVEKIRVQPYWGKLLRGHIRPKSVEIESPRLTVSMEMLSSMASRTVQPKRQALAPPPPKPVPDSTPPKQNPTQPPSNKKEPESVKKNPPAPKPKSPAIEQERVPPGLPVYLKITNAHLNLVSAARQTNVISIQGLDYEHVLLGEDSEGKMSISSLQILDQLEYQDIEQNMAWKRPFVEFEEQALDLGGGDAVAKVQLGIDKNGGGRLPFLFDFRIDRQKIESLEWTEHFGLVMDAEAVVARFRLSGLLPQPDSWRADGVFAAENLTVDDLHGIYNTSFDDVYVPFVLRQGTLRWAGVRLISEDIAVMGNGMLSMRDGHLSVTRLVVSPEVASLFTDGIRGLGIIGEQDQWWYDLDTPDRKIRDLVIWGPLLEPEIDAGLGYESLPFAQIISDLFGSLKGEPSNEEQNSVAMPAPSPTKE